MPFYFRAFWEAVRGYPHEIAIGYLKAITYYWGHEHCAGLKDDSEYLRKVCELDKDEWETAQEIIFDNNHFFVLGEDAKWHQKRASELYSEVKAAYESAVKGGKNRWKNIPRMQRTAIARRAANQRWK